MRHSNAFEVGRARAEQAAATLQAWTGIGAVAVCVLRSRPNRDAGHAGDWQPVGEGCWKEICSHNGAMGSDTYHLLVVDEAGSVKACSRERLDLRTVLELAERVPLPVASPGEGELWRALEREENTREARSRVLYADA